MLKTQTLSLLLLIAGAVIIVFVIVRPFDAKIAIVESALALLMVLIGIYFLDKHETPALRLVLSRPCLQYFPLMVGFSVWVFGSMTPAPVSAFAFASALAILFLLSKTQNVSKVYVAIAICLLGASVAYYSLHYFAIVTGVDSWRNLSVSSAIKQTGHFSDVAQPTAEYYYPFPVMSIAPAILSSLTGLDLGPSTILFPGALILLQPLLVFLLTRALYNDAEAAALSAFIVATEASVTQWMAAPIAQSTALSLMLIVLFALSRRNRSRNYPIVALLLFVMLVVLHGAVGIISIPLILIVLLRQKRLHGGLSRTFILILLGYLVATFLIDSFAKNAMITSEKIWESLWSISTPALNTPTTSLYGTVGNGLIFLWWGLPVSLALVAIVLQRRRGGALWSYVGLTVLGLSFIINIMDPNLVIDRYGGLTGWLILAMSGGKVLAGITRTRRQLLLLIPLMLLICLSGVVDPYVSPQYGYMGYQELPTTFHYYDLPTTIIDRGALQWVSTHSAFKSVISDHYSATYLIFSRYQSGVFVSRLDQEFRVSSYVFSRYHVIDPTPRSQFNRLLFFRWANAESTNQTCVGLVASLASQQSSPVVNLLFDNSCDVLEAGLA